jgi:predicted metal-binding protein
MPKFSKYIKRAKELGAKEAKVIPVKTIVVAEWVRMKCQFGCSGFGESLTCPPYSPTPEFIRRMLTYYKQALLVHGDAYTNIHAIIPKLEREIFLDGYFKAFGMGAGPCRLCEKCAKICRHPDKTRPSLEACGIDVYTTVRSNGYPIKVLKTTGCQGNYYGIVLIE